MNNIVDINKHFRVEPPSEADLTLIDSKGEEIVFDTLADKSAFITDFYESLYQQHYVHGRK